MEPIPVVLSAANPYSEPLDLSIENGPTVLLSPGDTVQAPMVVPDDMQVGSYVARRKMVNGANKLVKRYYLADKNAAIYPVAINNYPFE